jgi:hypothetical protein
LGKRIVGSSLGRSFPMGLPNRHAAFAGVLRYDLCVRQGNGTWPSLVKALVWGTREPGFKSRRPDKGNARIAYRIAER